MSDEGHTPRALLRRARRISPVWLTPLVAAGILIYLLVSTLETRGPTITIVLENADGISAGETQVKHRNVSLGTVEDVRLAEDLSHVVVRARMVAKARALLTDHARFWVVRPRLSPGNLGRAVETLVSGVYIEIDPGAPGGRALRHFVGSTPPTGPTDEPGRTFVLQTDDLGSLSVGAPVSYRGMTAGEVRKVDLTSPDGPIAIHVFVKSPYDAFVHADTTFWAQSGVVFGTSPQGLRLDIAPLPVLLSGGIAFETRAPNDEPPSEPDAVFPLHADKAQAEAATFKSPVPCVSYFRSSTNGLGPGSPVELFGAPVGTVTEVRLAVDPEHAGRLAVRVAYDLQPERLVPIARAEALSPDRLRSLIERGLRVTLASGSLVTGQRELALEYVPAVPKAAVAGEEQGRLVLPSDAERSGDIGSTIHDVAIQLDQIPFAEIGANLDSASRRLNGALGEDGYGRDSGFQRELERLVRQAGASARSLRVLADFLDRHPEAILRGRREGNR